MKYMYEIRPVKPIVTLEGRSLRRPSTMLLELEEVYHYSKLAAVWRKYPDTTTLVKVGGLNTAAAHCATYAEYLENMKKISQGETITVQDEPKAEEVAPEVPVVEEQAEEEIIPTPEDISEDVTVATGEQVTEVEESVEEVTPEVVEEAPVDPAVEEVAPKVVEEVAEESVEPTAEEVKELTDEEKELAEIQALIDAEDKKEEASVEVQGEVEEISSEKEEVAQVVEKPIADIKPPKKEHGFTQSKNIITPNKK